ncbi:fungal specific transcription factor [Colletotrichum orchidophilum]|uniref:Fungal specific transcription factor n=1 Tax=Colletotrichum orchidophilum TaxID=1209926 RepID=A0A1G4AXN4_9PEZI|nr:fungal specific transcription factor [Colletotrichum orchidophilum]OHE93891.1 fungal specific transcription factor [Colletotrichum orchidophilum]
MSSQLRIQSILSPASDSDDAPTAFSAQITPKRRYQETLSPLERTSADPAVAELVDRQAPGGAKFHSSVEPDDDDSRPTSAGGSGVKRSSRAMRPPMRSSIACLRCREFKVKCDNDNTGSPCDTCIKRGHKCEFPDPTPLPAKRSEPPTAPRQERRVYHGRKRVKKLEDATSSDGRAVAALAQEVLSAPYLTVDVWHRLFDIYKLNFAAELPFLHLPTLKGIIHVKDTKKPSTESSLILLGVLALTARFHPALVKYVAQITYDKIAGPNSRGALPRPEPSMASEYFANALTEALGQLESALTSASVVRVQAFLMLGLHKWSQPNGGLAAWMYVCVAIRMAQALKLGFEDKPFGDKSILAPSPRATQSARLLSDRRADQEVRRRTMFSCLILDRLLSFGSDRVSMVRSDDLRIQLPCTEHAFDLGRIVDTGFLPQAGQGMEPTNDNSVLSRFVQLADFWGDITKYSSAGGRRTESLPPWDQESTFFQLNKKLDAFYAHLPEEFTWSSSNFWKHDNSTYVSLHMLGALCKIMLHREYIPFIAIKCSKPIGPMDEPGFDPGSVPDHFWERSAEQVFKAGREIIDLISTCRDKLPHSSLVIFAIWQAAFIGIYARHYPHMDAENHMVSKQEIEERKSGAMSDNAETGTTSIAFQALTKAAPYFSMASNYVTHFTDIDQYLTKVCSDYLGSRNSEDGFLAIRLGGGGGGLEWRAMADEITSNGIIMDDDRPTAYDGPDGSRASTLARSSSSGLEYSLPSRSGTDGRRDSSQASSFAAVDAAVVHKQAGHDGYPGGIPHHSPTQGFSPTAGSLPNGAAMANMNAERVSIDSYVQKNKGQRFGTMFEDIKEFATGGMVYAPKLGYWDVLKLPSYTQMAGSSPLP